LQTQHVAFWEDKMKYIGMFINLAMGDSELDGRITQFTKGVNDTTKTAWKFIDPHVYGAGEYHLYQNLANSLVASTPNRPDLLYASCGQSLRALQIALAQDTGKPIVFGGAVDPMNLDVIMPGYKVYGVTSYKLPYVVNILNKLMKLSPNITTLGVVYDPKTRLGPAQLGVISGVAAVKYGNTTVQGISIRDPNLKTLIDNIAINKGQGGLIVVTTTYTAVQRAMLTSIVKTAEDNNNGFHAVFPNSLHARSGEARWYYGPNTLKVYYLAGTIAGTILNGDTPSNIANTTPPEEYP
jgi:ABC-type uncharacterized transport system substrate-binding protein